MHDDETAGAAREIVRELTYALERARELEARITAAPSDPAKAELLGTSEIAALFGVVPHTVTTWVARNRMPEPLARLASGPVWNRAQIDALRLERGLPAWPEEEPEQ